MMGEQELRVPPNARDAEERVLGALMLFTPDRLDDVRDMLDAGDFYHARHQAIFRAICETADAGKPIDPVTVADRFADDGETAAAVIGLAANCFSGASLMAHAELVREKAAARRLIEAGTAAVDYGFAGNLAEGVQEIHARLLELEPKQRGGLVPAGSGLSALYEDISERLNADTRLSGVATPWEELNQATDGLQRGQVIIVAGRPSMGKSIAGLNIAQCAAMQGIRTAVFSLEMSMTQCNRRNLSALSGVPHRWLMKPEEGEEWMWPRLSEAMQQMRRAPLLVDDTPALTARQMLVRARRAHRQEPLGLVVVDHIHDFKINPERARFEYGEIVQAGKTLAKELDIPVVMLAQLNRNVAKQGDKRPTLADLRESGEIEQKGDLILFLHREDYYHDDTHLQGVVEMHIAKGRDIEAGKRITLRNRYDQMRLDDWEGPLPEKPVDMPKSRARGFGRGRVNYAEAEDF